MLVYAPRHGPDIHCANEAPIAEYLASFAITDTPTPIAPTPITPASLTTALGSTLANLPGPIATLTLVIPAAQCRFANRSFPADLDEPEAHALAAQMATQIAAELGHTTPIAFDWRRLAANEISLCLAPRTLITGHMEAVRAAGLRCTAITPETDSAGHEPVPFNLIPWRNARWLQQGQRRFMGLAAASLLAITSAALFAHTQANREQTLSAQHHRLEEAIKTRKAQLPDLAKLRQQLAARQAAQHADRAARETTLRQQQALARQLDQLARKRPREIRYHSLSYDTQGMRLEGLAQTPVALTHLLKRLPCPHLAESHRDPHGPLRFTLQLPTSCTTTP
ncbi:MAG: hypothetical protein FJ210_02550 [Betaproteobacteria bacterium]|nr:hypothetical protein [Betaproteobacteria bacterium]